MRNKSGIGGVLGLVERNGRADVSGTNGTVWDDLGREWDGFGKNWGFWDAVFGLKTRVWDEMGRFGTVLGGVQIVPFGIFLVKLCIYNYLWKYS